MILAAVQQFGVKEVNRMVKESNRTIVDSLILSYVNTPENGRPVLVIGRKSKNNDVDIVNAFTGKEADDIYYSLFRGLK